MKNRIQKLKNRILGVPQEKYVNRRNPYVDRPRVLVAGRNYSSNLSIARSLGEAGYSVEVLRIYQTRPKTLLKKMKPDRYSKYIKAYYVFVSGRNDNSICNKLVRLADRKNKMLLIPSDDLVAAVSDKYYNRLKKYYLLQNVADTQGEINRIMEKGVQKELARKAGLPVLNSCVVQSRNGYFRIPDSVEYPCFIKPDVSRNGAKSRMKKCENEEQLNGWLTLFSQKRDISMLVEDYVEIVNEYSILGVSTKDGAIGPAAFVALHGGKDEHRGVALTGEILPLEALQPLADKLINFVSGLDFEGLYDIDLVETKDGTIYFVEINMRLGASGYAFTKCGVNLPGIFADYMIYHKPLDFNLKVSTIGKHFVSEKVLLDEYA
jgi:predicted ATP-grasp superfamily ATP-dependent carboligase